MMNSRKNESQACKAVVKCLEVLTGEKREDVRWPDKEPSGAGQVDMIVKLGKEEYAIEHTRLEDFEGEIKARKDIEKVLGVLREKVVGRIPGPSYYSVAFEADFCLPGGKKGQEAAEDIAEWVKKAIAILHERKLCRYGPIEQARFAADGIERRESGSDFNFGMSVLRWPFAEKCGIKPGSLRCHPCYRPGENGKWEESGDDRVSRAFQKKVPKLLKAKEAGAHTILVLESENIQGHLVSNEIYRLAEENAIALDEVYLVERSEIIGLVIVTVKRGERYQDQELACMSWHHIHEVGESYEGSLSERSGLPEGYIKALGLEAELEEMFPSGWDGWKPVVVSEHE